MNDMNQKRFRNRFLIKSVRHPYWDYSDNAYYFITICTRSKINYFGRARNNDILLSGIGEIVKKFWNSIPEHFDWIRLDEYIIMPDHLHGIIVINKKSIPAKTVLETTESVVSTGSDNEPVNQKHKNTIQPGSLGAIIGQFKRICTIRAREIDHEFAWQTGYYDRIIRTKVDLENTRKYIIENPNNYVED